MIKEEKGITLIKLCFLIVLLGIIFVMSFSAIKSSFAATDTQKFVIQMELLQEKVNVIRREYKLWEGYDPNEVGNYHLFLETLEYTNANKSNNEFINEFESILKEFNESEVEYWDKDIDSILANYYYFTPDEIETKFGLDNFENHIIINFYTGNIIAKDPVKDVNSNKYIHRQYDSEIGNELKLLPIVNEETTIEVSVIENYGLSQKIKVALKSVQENVSKPNINEIYYYRVGNQEEVRKKATELVDYVYNSQEKYATFTIDKSGNYSFVVEDSNSTEYTKVDYEVMLCNPPRLYQGLTGIYWDDAGVEYSITNAYDSNWYNYSKDAFKMANAKDEDGNYWVWVPRYIYEENAEGNINIDFVRETTMTSTRGVATRTYKLFDAFNEDTKGFWIAKYQSNINKNKLSIKPGKTLTIFNKTNAINVSNTMIVDTLTAYADLASDESLNAVKVLSKAFGVTIANDLVHYAGGSPNEKEILNNTKYSSSNNIFGIYDIETSEVEITKNSEEKEGRFRFILIEE